jgi:sterol desaturase/sphingolipid hydroxylase (fatty acid hydroxylase superfamily)
LLVVHSIPGRRGGRPDHERTDPSGASTSRPPDEMVDGCSRPIGARVSWWRDLNWSALGTTHFAAFIAVSAWVPLVLALAIDAIWSGSERSSLARLARPSGSARLDLAYTLVIDLPRLALFGVITPVAVAQYVFVRFIPRDLFPWEPLSSGVLTLLVTATVVLVLIDLLDYWTHRVMHRSRMLWPFHEVHHAATEMTLLTGVRVTLTERHLIDLVRAAVLVLLGLSIPAIAIVLVVRSIVDTLQHSNLAWTYGRLGYLVASPANHRLHHSVEGVDWDTNYGNLLAIWDHLFGTANPTMRSVNSTVTTQRLPDVGVPDGVHTAARGVWLWPVLSDVYLWTSLVRGGWRRSRSPRLSG